MSTETSKEIIKRLRTKAYNFEAEMFWDLIDCVDAQKTEIEQLEKRIKFLEQK